MRPSFLELQALARLDATLRSSDDPAQWRGDSEAAARALRPDVLILAPEAACLRAAWALGRISGDAGVTRLVWRDDGNMALALGPGAPLVRAEVRELTAGAPLGLEGALMATLTCSPPSAGCAVVVVFLSAGWPDDAETIAKLARGVDLAALGWRAGHLLANDACYPLGS